MNTAKEVNFGGWFKAELDKRGWTGITFYQRSGIGYKSAVYKWLTNTHRPEPDHCRLIADFLNVDPDAVLDAAGHRPRPAFIIATAEESALLFDLWRLAYDVTMSKWLPAPLAALDDQVQTMIAAGFIVPKIEAP